MSSCLLRPYAEETSARAVRLFTLAVAAGNQGFLAIGDWLKSYKQQLKELFCVERIPSYIDSGNDYLAAVKGNQPNLYQGIQAEFIPEETDYQVNKGHGRLEKRKVSICKANGNYPDWIGLKTIIRVECERQTSRKIEKSVRYYISSLTEKAVDFAQRIRGYWGIENKVHYVRDVTQGEDKSRIRTKPLPQIMAIARNLAVNLYRNAGFNNMAQAERKYQFGLEQILSLFRMK